MKIGVFGSGYVGLVTAVCLAELGNQVVGMDIDGEKVEKLNQAISPIYERGLDELLKANLRHKRLKFTTDSAEAVQQSDLLFIAVGTPPQVTGEPDMHFVEAVAKEIGRHLNGYKIIINKSTVAVGSSYKVEQWVKSAQKDQSVLFDVVSNPEFLKEGTAVRDFMEPDRIVIGSSSPRARADMAELYRPLLNQKNQILFMDNTSAEVTKYAANAFLATKISFINEIANFCEVVGANIDKVKDGLATDQRIGRHFLNAGLGYGGSCFPKDVQALLSFGLAHHNPFHILSAVEMVNDAQKVILLKKLKAEYSDLRGKKVALWGLSFKPFTDDIREAPSLVIIAELLRAGCRLSAHDPAAMENVQKLFPGVEYCDNPYDALPEADALCVLTEWSEYTQCDFLRVKQLLKQPLVIDGRNLFSPEKMQQLGFRYRSIGRPAETIQV